MSKDNSANQSYSVSSSRWVLTLNRPDDVTEEEFLAENPQFDALKAFCESSGLVAYCVMQYERGEEERLHGQAYLVLKKVLKRKSLKVNLHKSTSMKAGKAEKADDDRMRKYCCDPLKPGFVRFGYEYGTWPDSLALSEVKPKIKVSDEVSKMIDEGCSYLEIKRAHPGFVFRNRKLVLDGIKEVSNAKALEKHLEREKRVHPYIPKVWQYWLWKYLDEVYPDDRTIVTISDFKGKSGKNRFIREYCSAHKGGVQHLHAGKEGDLNLAFSNSGIRVLFLNITRVKAEHVKHLAAFCENVKDGSVFAGKYDSGMKEFVPPHIVVFSNDPVDTGCKGSYLPDRFIDEADPEGAYKEYKRKNPQCILDGYNDDVVWCPPGRGAPYTYDRYCWWDLDDALREVYDPQINNKFPPFYALTEGYERITFVPPEFGPAYSGDNAGDGPRREQIAPTRVPNWPHNRDRYRRLAGMSAWWCMKTGVYHIQPVDPTTVTTIYWKYGSSPRAPWYEFELRPESVGRVHSSVTGHTRKKIGYRSWFAYFPPTHDRAVGRMYKRSHRRTVSV
jgi:hypothetical protein